MEDFKQKILEYLKDGEWKSTLNVSKGTGINYYRVERFLHQLKEENKVELFKASKVFMWKVKQ